MQSIILCFIFVFYLYHFVDTSFHFDMKESFYVDQSKKKSN